MNWLHTLWFGYFWNSLKGNGPEDLIAFLLIGGGATYLGRWALREWRDHKDHVHSKLDHLILHSADVPNEVPGLPTHRQPKGAPCSDITPNP